MSLGSHCVSATIKTIADRIHFEDHASILIFYIYLSRDPLVIDYVVQCAKKIYADREPCDFEKDVEFVNRLYTDARPLVLPAGSPPEHRDIERERLDAVGDHDGPAETSEDARNLKYKDDLADLLKINFAFKTLNVLGQVVRNFPGSLERTAKREIAKECYLLGLRTLKAVLRISEVNLEEVRSYFARIILEHRSIGHVTDLAKTTDESVIWLTLGCAYGVVKRVSTAVGHEELRDTYADVLATLGTSTSAKLIDVSVRLDHFDGVPIREIEALQKEVRKNAFSHRVLRDLVVNFLYLHEADFRSRQRLGAMLNIETSDVRYLENPEKKRTS